MVKNRSAQFECCGTTNFTDWKVADLFPQDDENGVLSNGSSSIIGIHGNGSRSLSVPDSCCVDLLDHAGCGWRVVGKTKTRLNNIHTEARLIMIRVLLCLCGSASLTHFP